MAASPAAIILFGALAGFVAYYAVHHPGFFLTALRCARRVLVMTCFALFCFYVVQKNVAGCLVSGIAITMTLVNGFE
ncbi:MAG: hypothetical protein LUC93_18275 [Planctomycetaceae bacterium]|nr:hypothetical protein [Planctomycetaceae bacterium]